MYRTVISFYLPSSNGILPNLNLRMKDVRKALIDSAHINDAGAKYEPVN